MSPESGRPRYRRGHQPWDPINGMRVGGLTGGLLGGILMAVVGIAAPWPILTGAVVGGAVGYFDQQRRLRR